MTHPANPIQLAIVTKLKANSALTTLLGGQKIYDRVPKDAVFPYVSLGNKQILPDEQQSREGYETYSQLDVWATEPGYVQAQAIAAAVRAAIGNELTVTGFLVSTVRFEDDRANRDPDGVTSHVSLMLKILLASD